MTETNPIIAFSNVRKYFGELEVLKDINFNVSAGERIVVCGPSGSGKSTLIRCINGLETIQQGKISVADIDLTENKNNIERIRFHVGMVFQQFNLFPHLTALENCILSPMLSQRLSKTQASEMAMHYLSRVHVPDQAEKYPSQLSGGQQQRVAIARALCLKPEIMLFDEPTSALDPEMVKEVLDTMVELADDGITMLCVTHEMGFARSVADRVIFMADGMIVEETSPDRFFDSPNHPQAQRFVNQIISH